MSLEHRSQRLASSRRGVSDNHPEGRRMFHRETIDWVRTFLDRRGLEKPDQRELYRYRCTDGEYRDLRRVLRLIPDFMDVRDDRRVCGALVLGIAEWSRREKHPDQWEWEPIFEAFDFELDPAPRGDVMTRGLEDFWGRPIHRFEAGHRDFLGSLMSEGGLPFQVLRAPGNPLHVLFVRLLRRVDQAEALGADMEAFVRREIDASHLPQVFSSVGPVRLITGMLQQLRSLVRSHGLESQEEPVAFLDQQDPQWRERFPIPLDQETGEDFLNSLLKTASDEGRRRRRTGALSCTHVSRDVSIGELETVVTLPAELQVPLEHVPASSRLEVEILEGTEPCLRLGAVFADLSRPGFAKIRLRAGERRIRRSSPNRFLLLAVSAGGLQAGKVLIPGGAVALGEVPVGFAWRENRWHVCGQASFRTEDRDVLVTVPTGVSLERVEPEDANVRPEPVPRLGLDGYRVSGQVTVSLVGDDRFSVRTGQAGAASMGLGLAGDMLDWPTNPPLCLRGMPRIDHSASGGAADVADLGVYVGGERIESLPAHELGGVRSVSIRNRSGETLLRRKVGILPSDFAVQLIGGDQPGQGWIRVTTAQRCLVELDDDRVEVQRTREDEASSLLYLQAVGEIPASVAIRVTPSLVADPIEIRLPFPYVGCLALDRDGRPLARDLAVDDLLGARLMLYGAQGGSGFSVTLLLSGYGRGQLYDRWIYRVGQQPLEISLHGLREKIVELLSIDTDIDCEVRLEVEGGPVPVRHRVRLFGVQLRRSEGNEFRVHVADGSGGSAEGLDPRLMLLHAPSVPAVSLEPVRSEGVPTGEFRLPEQVSRDGPWLVVPGPDSKISFRPLLVPGEPDSGVDLERVESLQKAVLAFRPGRGTTSFDEVLDAMSENPRHGGWEFLNALYRNFGYLPLTTFEVWKALVQHPRALCMAMFKFEMDENFVGRLERDFPLFFEMLPVRDFRAATEIFHRFLVDQGIPEDTVNDVLGRTLQRLEHATVAYGTELQGWLRQGDVEPQARQAALILPNLFEQVIRERVDVEWPDYGARELTEWIGGRADEPAGRIHTQFQHRNSVAYLPAFVAAIALGEARVDEVFHDYGEALFQFRRIRDFDATWFRIAFNASLFARL
ncbi:STY4851/ECs_5259 family protein [Thioalkalivibrio sp. ALE20]|uniref:STY4851/ECs_5259 family protein n=1 Tax=Thioalkalivibrio sp. ALE20 TaxID=545275 RepID=UPI000382BB34|nr:STY4851/ECs_5259 family protein [Thioalkalivibrio sp. ALE20]